MATVRRKLRRLGALGYRVRVEPASPVASYPRLRREGAHDGHAPRPVLTYQLETLVTTASRSATRHNSAALKACSWVMAFSVRRRQSRIN